MIRFGAQVEAALARGHPVVALETTLVAHGLPRPANLETALAMEAAVREAGATPATIGVIAGRPTIGLSGAELELLACQPNIAKASRRDLPVLAARGQHGATTVAATLVIMKLAGLSVLATGGIGGVHRGGELTLDISADLAELARTGAVVVCSGAKSILDLPRTIELLETLGVTVLGFRTDEMPAFYSSVSGLPVTARVADAVEAATIFSARSALRIGGAVVLAVPPPPEHALDSDEIEAGLESALAQAESAGVRGGSVTPFLLDRMVESTGGRSLAANRALLVNNAVVAAEVAIALAGTRDDQHQPTTAGQKGATS